MNIPKQFQLGGIVYDVVEEEHLPDAYGATYFDKSKVVLLETLQPQVKGQTFCHELVHCILYAMGKPTPHDEAFVDAFATFLHQYLVQRDNTT
jgi:predicted SprT family Zn-dependent metalloprotease